MPPGSPFLPGGMNFERRGMYVVYRLDKYNRRQYVVQFLTERQKSLSMRRKPLCMNGFSQAPERARQFENQQQAQQAAERMDAATRRQPGTCVVTTMQEAQEQAAKGWCRRNGFSRFARTAK